MDEATFILFEGFDFGNNEHFQAGWRSIEMLLDPKQKTSEYLRAKAFFFTKNVKAFDYQQYLQWRNRKHTDQMESEGADSKIRGHLDCPSSHLYTVGQEGGQDPNSLSLAEVAELIQNNQPIPGVMTVDVMPSNMEPTPSMMARRLKPWEKTTAGNAAFVPQQQTATGELSGAIT